jgi:Leucine-rich repeat (LRR) protein
MLTLFANKNIDDLVFSEMDQLKYLDVSHNQLSRLPVSLGGLCGTLDIFLFDSNPFDYLFSELLKSVSHPSNKYEPTSYGQGM